MALSAVAVSDHWFDEYELGGCFDEVQGVLASGRCVCQDLAYSAVSMCRSSGIPARSVSGTSLMPTSRRLAPSSRRDTPGWRRPCRAGDGRPSIPRMGGWSASTTSSSGMDAPTTMFTVARSVPRPRRGQRPSRGGDPSRGRRRAVACPGPRRGIAGRGPIGPGAGVPSSAAIDRRGDSPAAIAAATELNAGRAQAESTFFFRFSSMAARKLSVSRYG